MNDILGQRHLGVLQQMAWSNVLLAFDFDGTLAPIVPKPDDARLSTTTRALLEQVSKKYPCVVISGRSQADVLRRVRGIAFLEIIGNHGLEADRRTVDYSRIVQEWLPPVTDVVERFKGVQVEDKHFSLAVHYRHCREKKTFREALSVAVRGLKGVRVVGGKEVVNLIPSDGPDKGKALQAARSRLACDTALFLGDDETDEDVFRLDEPGRLLSIRVGASPSSAAGYFIEAQESVDDLLTELVRLRPAGGRGVQRGA